MFGISRAGAVWCPINPRNEAAENGICWIASTAACLLFQSGFAPLVEQIRPDLPKLTTLVCLDAELPFAPSFDGWMAGLADDAIEREPVDDLAMIVGHRRDHRQAKGRHADRPQPRDDDGDDADELSVQGRPVYLALAPLTHAAGVLCFPVMALGGEVVMMPRPTSPSSSR